MAFHTEPAGEPAPLSQGPHPYWAEFLPENNAVMIDRHGRFAERFCLLIQFGIFFETHDISGCTLASLLMSGAKRHVRLAFAGWLVSSRLTSQHFCDSCRHTCCRLNACAAASRVACLCSILVCLALLVAPDQLALGASMLCRLCNRQSCVISGL